MSAGAAPQQPRIPGFYRRGAAGISRDVRFGLNFQPSRARFDENGSLLAYGDRLFNVQNNDNVKERGVHWTGADFAPRNITSNEKSIAEAMNFFGNLYGNKDINAALEEYRGRLERDPSTGLVSDPTFNIIRERGTAASIEAGRRLGGIRESGTGRGVADFLTTAEAQQRTYEDERAAGAATNLFNMNFQRGQAGFIPTQTFASVMASLAGGNPSGGPQQFGNAKGEGGNLLGGILSKIKLSGGTSGGSKGSGSATSQGYGTAAGGTPPGASI